MQHMVIQRAQLLKELRHFFDDRGFYEVQPPCLSRDCVIDAYLDPIAVRTEELRLSARDLPPQFFLQTSPESAMKRMLVGGAPSIYSIGPVFRCGESGDHHNIEFTMLEWYHRDACVDEEMQLLGELACETLDLGSIEVITYREAFQRHVGLDPINASLVDLKAACGGSDSVLVQDMGQDRDSILDVLLAGRVQPHLSGDTAWIIRDYPLSQAALACRSQRDPDCASRFELFVDGIELANGYDELRDAKELVDRYQRNNAVRSATGRDVLPVETTLVRAMRDGLPPCCGVALGVDRLLMLVMGAKRIADVIPFTVDRA